jgi:hypothetical protein
MSTPDYAYLVTFRDYNCPDQNAALPAVGTGHALETIRRKFKDLEMIRFDRLRVCEPAKGDINSSIMVLVTKRKDKAAVDRFFTRIVDMAALMKQCSEGEEYYSQKLEWVR